MSRIEHEVMIMGRIVKIKGDQVLIARNEDDWYRYKQALAYGMNEGDMEQLANIDFMFAERIVDSPEFKELTDEYFMNGWTDRLDTWEESEIRCYIEVRTGYRRLKGDTEEWAG